MWKVLCLIAVTSIGCKAAIPQEKAISVGADQITLKPDNSECPKCTCGLAGRNGRIFGGSTIERNRYSWMAAVMTGEGDEETLCGGSLINNKYVLSAAHCFVTLGTGKVVSGSTVKVRLMSHNITNHGEKNNINLKVEKVIVHPNYNPKVNQDNDIALLRLNTKGIVFGPGTNINPVCMPPKDETFAGVVGIAAGWGLTEELKLPALLQEVQLSIMSYDECSKIMSNEYSIGDFTRNMLCAMNREGEKDTCSGDSGGPLVIKKRNTYYVVGVTSWGLGCAEKNKPGMYTKVNNYLDWLQENTKDACSCTNE